MPKRANSAGAPASSFRFPKSARILRRADYRTVYDQGFRVSNPLFAAFCFVGETNTGPRIGITTTKALGGAVIRNRLKRRFREVFRLHRQTLDARWNLVINPRRAAIDAPFAEIEQALMKVISKCRH